VEPQWHEVGRVISLISLKWALSVMRALEQQPLRHNDLQRAIPGIGPAALGDILRRMEAAGLIARHVNVQATPPVVSYEVTEPARELCTALEAVASWGRQYLPGRPDFPATHRAGWSSNARLEQALMTAPAPVACNTASSGRTMPGTQASASCTPQAGGPACEDKRATITSRTGQGRRP
jgi:DNA-binding HxlR family transcriptional regulator